MSSEASYQYYDTYQTIGMPYLPDALLSSQNAIEKEVRILAINTIEDFNFAHARLVGSLISIQCNPENEIMINDETYEQLEASRVLFVPEDHLPAMGHFLSILSGIVTYMPCKDSLLMELEEVVRGILHDNMSVFRSHEKFLCEVIDFYLDNYTEGVFDYVDWPLLKDEDNVDILYYDNYQGTIWATYLERRGLLKSDLSFRAMQVDGNAEFCYGNQEVQTSTRLEYEAMILQRPSCSWNTFLT